MKLNKKSLVKKYAEIRIEYGMLNKYFENSNDIEFFLIQNYKEIEEVKLYHTGGGIWIYYILIDNKIYSIGDELFDGKNNCIIYYGFDSIDEYLDFEDDMQNQGKDLCYDDVKQKSIKI